MLLLAACGTRPVQQPAPQADAEMPWLAVWQADAGRYNAAVRQLTLQSDDAMRNHNYDKAGTLLERALRIDNRVASLWSRLGWVALQNGQYSRAQNLLQRSNSLSGDESLHKVNWQFYLNASEAAGDAAGVARARKKLAVFN